MTKEEIREKLFDMQDIEYKAFQLKLMPGVSEDRVIGVRTPALRAFAREIQKSGNYEDFIEEMPHAFYDEMNLHGFIISEIKDFDKCVKEVDRMLPYVDNWATCDLLSPKKAFKKNTDRLVPEIKRWMASDKTYTVRFGIEMLMSFFLDELFLPEHLQWVAEVQSEEYYVNMMRAWYFATALAKQYDATVPLFEKQVLDPWTHNKSIQKARESFRVGDEQKGYLNRLKIKGN